MGSWWSPVALWLGGSVDEMLATLRAPTEGDHRLTGGDGGHLYSCVPVREAEMSGSVALGTSSGPLFQDPPAPRPLVAQFRTPDAGV